MATGMKHGACVFTTLDEAALKDAKWELKFFMDRNPHLAPDAHKKHPWEPLPPQKKRTNYPGPVKPPLTAQSQTRAATAKNGMRPLTGMSVRSRCSQGSCISLSNASTNLMCKICAGVCKQVSEHFPNLGNEDASRPTTQRLKTSSSMPALPDVTPLTRRVQHRRNQNGNYFSDAPGWKQG
mmetsp:Transcript_27379/g.43875  ORF Transcript_27379/g.43875 Transcript_27379/m.43875 type:complete len:181 (-) Transcript_27379:73-615(-)